MDTQANVKAYGGMVPTSLVHLFDETGANIPGGLGNPANKVQRNLYQQHPAMLHLRDDGQRITTHFSGAALYSPVSYVPYIPFFLLGKLASFPFFWVITLCRLVGVVMIGLAFAAAIRYSPVGKWIFFAVGLLPSVEIQAQSVGADAPQLAVCVLFTLLIVRLVYSPHRLKWHEYGLLLVLGTAVALIKLAYAPMLLLLLALPLVSKQYRGRKNMIILIAILILSFVPSLVWSRMVAYVDINSNPQANFVAQQAFIVHQPLIYLRTLYYTFFTNEQMALANLFSSFVQLPAIYTYLACATMVLAVLVRSKREVSLQAMNKVQTRLWRSYLLGTAILTVVLIGTALYIYSSTYHQSSIIGIQSRYFLPVLPLILFIFYGNEVKKPQSAKRVIVILSCVVLAGAILAIHHRLYEIIPAVI